MQCDWVGGENLVQFLSVRIHPLFLSIYSLGDMNDFHITMFEAEIFARMLSYKVFWSRISWNEGMAKYKFWQTDRFFAMCSNWLGRRRQMWERRRRKNKTSWLYLCMWASEQPLAQSVHHSRCVSALSFIMAADELAVLLPYVTKLLNTTSILITPRQLQAHLQHSSTCYTECTT